MEMELMVTQHNDEDDNRFYHTTLQKTKVKYVHD